MKKSYEEHKLHICVLCRLIGLLMFCFILSACGLSNSNNQEQKPADIQNNITAYNAGTYDSADTNAIVITVNREDNKITFYNRVAGKQYTLEYDGTTKFFDKYGSSLVPEQIKPGDLVDVTFLKGNKLLNSLAKSQTAWTYSDIKSFTIDSLTGNMKMMDGDYRFRDTIQVFCDGEKATLMDINEVDTLTVAGNEHEIYSIVIDEGHGYLRLKGQDYFVGGWIDIGSGIVKNVTEDMLLTVPVGTYEIRLSNGKYDGSTTVTVERGKEALLDVTDMVIPEDTKYGDLIFVTTPEKATIYIDGKEIDKTTAYKVEYGIHQMIVRASGYDTITQYIKVGQEHATLEVTLEKSKNSDKEDASPSPQVTTYITPSVLETETSKYKVKIEAPEEAEVFLDGSYVGIVPTEFAKIAGTHTITLRKAGYETRSYTITLDSLLQNESFSFALLKKIEAGEEEKEEPTPTPTAAVVESQPTKTVEKEDKKEETSEESEKTAKEENKEESTEVEGQKDNNENNASLDEGNQEQKEEQNEPLKVD